MSKKAPGKSHREGISLMQLTEMFPDEESAVRWFEAIQWPNGRHCPKCGSLRTSEVPGANPMPYWCGDCRSYFSVKTGTSMARSKLPMRKWAFAVYLYVTNLKGVSSMKLHRDLGVTQQTAWFMLGRLRAAWGEAELPAMEGPVEADELYLGGIRKNMPKKKRKELTGRGAVGKTPVVGIKDRATNQVRAQVVESVDAETVHEFIRDTVDPNATLYSDESSVYRGAPVSEHEAVNHSVGEYVRLQAHVNGIESFWAMLRRAHKGTFHKISPKHLQRYIDEFTHRHGIRDQDTLDQMAHVVAHMAGKQLLYRELVAGNGLPNGARPG